MAQSNKTWLKNQPSIELEIDKSEEVPYNSDTVSIRSLIDGKVRLTGTVTGTIYIWDRAGSIAEIDIRDKDEILNKKRGRSCCGGNSGKNLFELA